MYLTWLDSNSWLVEMGGKRILIDPWLVGSLVFGNLDWFFKGFRTKERTIPENIDLIVLSQGLEDHAHTPTLKQIDRNIPVVASPNAAKVVKQLNYTEITALAHGETFNLDRSVAITATPGSSIGPTLVENGYIIKELETGFSVYYEPHGHHSPSLKQFAPIDVVITPQYDLGLPLVGPIIRGRKHALEVAQWLQPQVMIHTASGGDVVFEGLLNSFLQITGSIAEFRSLLAQNHLSVQVIEPTPGDRFEITVTSDQ
ncbi:Zn-dependent hydrolase [Scytonema hofmannii PCC 7110]|uniref:Zn-dependent hydrolase n=1 Tax=Scytonema hofmannii PCC 7110 TaxID=128403 RepID=A0A139XD80_9CYAN|nr:MBL fold metallo-hydrolase [Scytonema hofmannii]KYC42648.1 Zn-dependent hydrolase [Scytonema hofmannii PCC 7110]